MAKRWYIRASAAWLVVLVVLVGAWLLPRAGVPTRFWLAPLETVRVADRELYLVRTESKGVGLMGVTTLGALDGMLFVFDTPRQPPAGMFMKDTLIPLDAAFFDEHGQLIEVITRSRIARDSVPHARSSSSSRRRPGAYPGCDLGMCYRADEL